MKKIPYLIFGVLSLFVISCTNSTNEEATVTENESIITTPESNWRTFWTTFQAAVNNKDVEMTKELCIWSESFDEAAFNDQYEMYFNSEMREFIGKTKADAVPETPDAPMNHATKLRTFQLLETTEDEENGEVYESALMLYFGKKGEKYGLIGWMAAG
ncbi:MAG: hypothetical protein ACPG19_09430 [Saprospiraceae bacterium]